MLALKTLFVYSFYSCTERECLQTPEIKSGHKLVQDGNGKCCKNYRSVPETCDIENNCEKTNPNCEYFEDVVQYSLDECCVTYECKCNPSKCLQLGNPKCPIGSKRIIIDHESCCSIGKCVVIDEESSAVRAKDSILSTYLLGDLLDKKLEKEILNRNMISSISSLPEVLEEKNICVDSRGHERKLGESWTEKTPACKVCICYEENVIR